MGTTVTLDPDTEALVRRRMRERGLSFKKALNEAVKQGAMGEVAAEPFRTPTFSLGRPLVDLDRALQISAEIEDDELANRVGSDT